MEPLDEAVKELGEGEIVRELKRRLDSANSALAAEQIFNGALKYKLEKRKEEVSSLNRELARMRKALAWFKQGVGWIGGTAAGDLLKDFERKMSKREFEEPEKEDD